MRSTTLSTAFTARILEASASAYAGAAASLLLEKHPDVAERFAPSALRDWQSNLQQRVLELAAALGASEPKLFSSRIRWERRAFRARNLEEEDLRSSLTCLRETLLEELPEPAQDAVGDYLTQAIGTLDEAPLEETGLNPSNRLERHALRYMEPALKGDGRHAIDLLVSAVGEELTVTEAYLTLLMAQKEIGRMWHMGELEVAEEHVVTATTERATSVLLQRAERRPSNGKTVIAGTVAGNRHALAVRVLADLFEIAGWRSICLGADIPCSDLASASVYFNADLVALSVALPTQLKSARQTIEAIRARPERDTKIMVGGGAFREVPELWRELGADGSTLQLEEAVTLGERLVGLDG